ncbi:MAG: alpha-1,4-glucan--maltose-1-phosphate maltosyltransferase [Actinomycetota bacterium]|nr:alpha-1,4-glucan--maltose-1-phosphate maltosyltransferase [Actinomycetota bacterium]
MLPRIAIYDIRPSTPHGYPAKAVVGELVRVSADIFKDGHDVLDAQLRWRPAGDGEWGAAAMRDLGNDRWEAVIEPTELGRHELVVEAWTDLYGTWRNKVTTKLAAGQDIGVELEEGALLFESRAAQPGDGEKRTLSGAIDALRDEEHSPEERLRPAMEAPAAGLVAGTVIATDVTIAEPAPLWVDRERGLVSAWYELFPRSYGGFGGTADRLPAIAGMGFDVAYLPPIHPIGRQHRKGPNNALEAGPDDVGSPWAIGGPEGGHTAVHPDLGTLDDFRALVERARELEMEIALDYALQCSPDHPWLEEHPEWFHHRPDGSIAYAENPPKKYEDIYRVNLWPDDDSDRRSVWDACKDILLFWIDNGVRIFRVDNPHTSPLAFWEWVITAVHADHPDVIFLAEAFTRPKVMDALAEIGFSQSYTYFTWRTSRSELEDYVDELARGRKADYMRPIFWPNTPDILSGPLREGPPAAFRQRLVLAATMVPSYGIYSGYELCENRPMSDDNEEYHSSEKYEVKHRDWDQAHSLAPFITRLNEVRRRHPALQRLRNIHFHGGTNPQVIAYSKHTEDRSDVVLTVVTLDPRNAQESNLSLDLGLLGLPWDQPFEVLDELSGDTFRWLGPSPYVRLEPDQTAHILQLKSTP